MMMLSTSLTRRPYLCKAHRHVKTTCLQCHSALSPDYLDGCFERFARRVMYLGDCWLWIGGRNAKGYSAFPCQGLRIWTGHHFAFFIFKGPLYPTLTLDHLCRNQLCVNPFHLEQVSLSENLQRQYRIPTSSMPAYGTQRVQLRDAQITLIRSLARTAYHGNISATVRAIVDSYFSHHQLGQ
jgi:hypothetical protein